MDSEDTSLNAGQQALAEALGTSFRLLRWLLVLALLAYLASGLFIVRQDEKALVLVFGKIAGTGADRVRGPGIHWTFPKPVAEVVRISAERIRSLETDSFWYFEEPLPALRRAGANVSPTLNPARDGCTLTADANLLHSKWSLRYTVPDPEAFLFGAASAPDLLRKELDHAIVQTTARFPVDRALRTDVEAFRAAVEETLRARCDRLGLGARIERVDALSLVPPRQVAPAFDAVVAAEQERSRQTSGARAEAARTGNEAQGDAARIRSEGEAAAARMLAEISADADYFTKVREKYIQDPEVTRRTLWQDTLRRALARVEQKYVVYEGAPGKQEFRILLSPERAGPPAKGGR